MSSPELSCACVLKAFVQCPKIIFCMLIGGNKITQYL